MQPEYDDIEVVIDQKSYQTLLDAGVDAQLARHIAHLFVRDPLVIYSTKQEAAAENCLDCQTE